MHQLQTTFIKFRGYQWMTLPVCLFAASMFVLVITSTPSRAQQSTQQVAQENTEQDTAGDSQEEAAEKVIDEVAIAKMSPLEQLQFAADGDVNTRYIMLARISPRGASDKDRAEMVRLLISQLGDVKIGCIDEYVGADSMVERVRNLADRHVYFHGGFYYFKDSKLLHTNCENGIKSKSYKDLLVHVWLASKNQSTTTR